MDNTQTNTRPGAISRKAGEDLSGLEGMLIKLENLNGEARFALPDAETDDAIYILQEGGGLGTFVKGLPLSSDCNRRVRLSGTCNPGDRLVLAASGNLGKLRALPTAAGTYRLMAIAEEAGVDGQNALVRSYPAGLVTVTE